MALESRFLRLREVIRDELNGFDLDTDGQVSLIQAALTAFGGSISGGRLVPLEIDINFRAMDRGNFRLVENAVLDDSLKVADSGAGAAVVETLPIPLSGRPLLLRFSRDLESESQDGPGEFDFYLDAHPDYPEAGSLWSAGTGGSLTWDTEIYVDAYPADHLVIRISVTGNQKLGSVKCRVLFGGFLTDDSLIFPIAWMGCSIFHRRRLSSGNKNRLSVEQMQELRMLSDMYRKDALGKLLGDTQQSSGAGQATGPVQVAGYHNPYRDEILSGSE
ncbi:hypothetical protein KJZ99_00080 [bacterium]|nr:hypothetical protein [bacterium]